LISPVFAGELCSFCANYSCFGSQGYGHREALPLLRSWRTMHTCIGGLSPGCLTVPRIITTTSSRDRRRKRNWVQELLHSQHSTAQTQHTPPCSAWALFVLASYIFGDMWRHGWYRDRQELEVELIQTRVTQKPLLWVEVGKSACVLVGICESRLSLPARYDPQCPSLLDFLSGCLVRVLWTWRSSTDPVREELNRPRPIIELSPF
jgi:hypothetical protein